MLVGEKAVESPVGEGAVGEVPEDKHGGAEPERQPASVAAAEAREPRPPARRGWWQRRFGGTE
jgi:hypothetical protein